ncbi:TonB family protein, partial [Telmatospirillum siberiense]
RNDRVLLMTETTGISLASPPGKPRFPGVVPGIALSFGLHAAVLGWCLQATSPGTDESVLPAGAVLAVALVAPPPPEEPERESTTPARPPASDAGTATRRKKIPPPAKTALAVPTPLIDGKDDGTTAMEATPSSADGPSAPTPPGGAPEGKTPSADEDSLRLYGETIRTLILAHRPGHARSRGTVELRFTIFADGRLDSAAIAASSGSDTLDQSALAALRAAAPFPPCPDAAGPLTFSLPFQFR